LAEPTDIAQKIYATACDLYAASGLASGVRLRLVGVRATGLGPAAGVGPQLALGERADSWRDAGGALDGIARKFGAGAVRPGSLVPPGDGDRRRNGPAGSATP